jgi:CRP/FNR family transcriptional regulator, cyclic AMP receptor protein
MPARADRTDMMRQILKRHRLFGCLTAAELGQLLARARVETYKARQVIFRKGAAGSGLLAVMRGKVRISADGPDGDQIILTIVGEGEVFGEMALLDNKERSADATALTNCELLAIDRRDFVPFVRANPEVSLRLMAVLCERLRNTNEQMEDVLFLDAGARISKKLLQLADALEKPAPQHPRVISISQRELGYMVGLTRESINKHLSAWAHEGVLKVEGGNITILDSKALRDLAAAP